MPQAGIQITRAAGKPVGASLLANALCQSAEGPSRNTALGIAQAVMLGELAVNQALDNVVPKE
jgi:hypothetical protein